MFLVKVLWFVKLYKFFGSMGFCGGGCEVVGRFYYVDRWWEVFFVFVVVG